MGASNTTQHFDAPNESLLISEAPPCYCVTLKKVDIEGLDITLTKPCASLTFDAEAIRTTRHRRDSETYMKPTRVMCVSSGLKE